MDLMEEKVKNQAKKVLESMDSDITLLLLTEPLKCFYCRDTLELYNELTTISDKIHVENFTLTEFSDLLKFNILERTPLTIMLDDKHNDTGIRFYGITAGFEFSALLQTILLVSNKKTSLKESSVQFLSSLKYPLDLKVFVSTSCPYCPSAVYLAHQIASINPLITSSMFEVSEFPDIAQSYNIMGVPKTVINNTIAIEGAAPELKVIDTIKSVVN